MSRRTGLSLILLLGFVGVSLAQQAPAKFPETTYKAGDLKYVQGMPVVTVRGTPAEIGEQFGILAVKNAPDIDGLHQNFLKDAKIDGKFGLIKLMSRRLKPGFPADHLTEIEAMAKSSGRDLDLAIYANTVYDLSSSMGCSTMIVEKNRSKTGQPLMGRNFDWLPTKGITDHTVLAVIHPKGKHSFALITISPIVGCISGMNDAGLSCTLNEIHIGESKEKTPFNWDGTPTMLAFRRVLEECTTVAEAEKLLNGMKRTTNACLTICDKNGGAVFEITPTSIQVRSAINNVCCCTNHFRSPILALKTKCDRYTCLEANQQTESMMSVDDVFAELHKVHQKKFTLQAMVFEPAGRVLHLKYGGEPATKLTARTFDLGAIFDAK